MLFIGYSRCSTAKKAKEWLIENNIKFDERDIKTDRPTEDEQFEILASDGMLVKRPVLVGDDFVLLGFREAEWKEKLL